MMNKPEEGSELWKKIKARLEKGELIGVFGERPKGRISGEMWDKYMVGDDLLPDTPQECIDFLNKKK